MCPHSGSLIATSHSSARRSSAHRAKDQSKAFIRWQEARLSNQDESLFYLQKTYSNVSYALQPERAAVAAVNLLMQVFLTEKLFTQIGSEELESHVDKCTKHEH